MAASPDFWRGTDIEMIYALGNPAKGYAYTMISYKRKQGWTQDVITDKIKNFHVYAEAKIAISPEEMVDCRLYIPKDGSKLTFTMQYRHLRHKIKIRTDSKHDPHIDIEVEGKDQIKTYLEDVKTLIQNPSDYEYTTNMILRLAEKYCNPVAGVLYWLFPSGVDSAGLVDLFVDCKQSYRVNTTMTDIARIVSIRAYQEMIKGKKLTPVDYRNLIIEEFETTAQIEKKNGGIPQEARDVKYQPENSRFPAPFPIMFRGTADVFRKIVGYDENGNEMQVVPFGATYTW